MPTSIPFFVSDTSPLFSYLPCRGCSPGGTAGSGAWQSAFAPRGDGYDVTFHEARNPNAVIVFNTTARSLDIQTSVDGKCTATYALDDGDFTEGCRISLDGQNHQVRIKAQDGINTFEFFGISGTGELSGKGAYVNQTIDDTSPSFTYSDSEDWTSIDKDGITANGGGDDALKATHEADIDKYFNGTARISTRIGARVDLQFKASAIYLFGTSGPDGGTADLYLDGQFVNSLNFNNSAWTTYSSLLFFKNDLSPSGEHALHNLSLVSTSSRGEIIVDYALTSASKSDTGSSTNLPLILGSIAGTSLFLLIVGVLLFFYCSNRRFNLRSKARAAQYPFADGIGNQQSSDPKIDRWRKALPPLADIDTEEGKPRPDSYSTTVARQSLYSGLLLANEAHEALTPPGEEHDAGHTARDGSRERARGDSRRRAKGGMAHPYGPPRGSPPPEYPDYVPYRGPIEQPPAPPRAMQQNHQDVSPVPGLVGRTEISTPANEDDPRRTLGLDCVPPPETAVMRPGIGIGSRSSRDGRVVGWINDVQAATPDLAIFHGHRLSIDNTSQRTALTSGMSRSVGSFLSLHDGGDGSGLGVGALQLGPRPRHSGHSHTHTHSRACDDPSSPTSTLTLSSAALGEMTGQAMRAKGSIARVWSGTGGITPQPVTLINGAPASSLQDTVPVRDWQGLSAGNSVNGIDKTVAGCTPSSRDDRPLEDVDMVYREEHSRKTRSIQSFHSLSSLHSEHFAPFNTTAGNLISSRDQLIGSRINLSFSTDPFLSNSNSTVGDTMSGASTTHLNPTPTTRPSTQPSTDIAGTGLRRGVSIKSVKTFRSFFSGLMGNERRSYVPDTPALPPLSSTVHTANQDNRYSLSSPRGIHAADARLHSGVIPIPPLRSDDNSTTTPLTLSSSMSMMKRDQSATGEVGDQAEVGYGHRHMSSHPQTEIISSSSGTDVLSLSPRALPTPSVQSPSSESPSPCIPALALGDLGLGGMGGMGQVIELDPNSPVTVFAPSRPASEMPAAQW